MQINDYNLAFVAWNIFLALIPCWTVYFMSEYPQLHRNKLLFVPLFLLWFFMLPNTAYLFMMPRHLVDYCMDYDLYRVCRAGSWPVMFFFVYGLIGLPTFYYALSRMRDVMKSKWLPVIMVPLTSIGLMFGLYERFNSWDVLSRPASLLEAVASYFQDSLLLHDFLVFTLGLYLIYYITDFFWRWLR